MSNVITYAKVTELHLKSPDITENFLCISGQPDNMLRPRCYMVTKFVLDNTAVYTIETYATANIAAMNDEPQKELFVTATLHYSMRSMLNEVNTICEALSY